MNHPTANCRVSIIKLPLPCLPGGRGGDKGEGEQRFCHPHLSSPIPGWAGKGEELHSNPVVSYRELSSEKSECAEVIK